MSHYYFKEEHNLFRESLQQFLNKEVIPNIDAWEENQQIPKSIWKKMGEMGFLGLSFPEEFGGSGLDFFYDVIFLEETSKVFSGGFSITQSVVQCMSGPYIVKHGSQRLKEKYLPSLSKGEKISCIGISEPGAGSDVANIKTTATLEGDYYVVNGSKTFITNGYYGDFVIGVVKTDPEAGLGGISLLVIDLEAEGITKNKLNKLGWHASDTAELGFTNVKVPKENLIGVEGKGFYYLMGGLQLERLAGAIMGYAGTEKAIEYTLQYMSERHAFNRPINKFQVLRHRMAQLAAETESCKQFVMHCARMHNDGVYAVKECSMAKLLATELSDKAAYQCLQSFGGYGFIEDYKIARVFRDSRVGTIGGGTSEIMREIIAKIVIDGVSFEVAKDNVDETTPETTNEINFDDLVQKMAVKAQSAQPIGNTLKFNFGGQFLYLDGSGDQNTIHTADEPADCQVDVSIADFVKLTQGELDPMSAVMGGKVQIKGDMGVAMKLKTLFG